MLTMTKIVPDTADVLADMLTEDTGRHLLDSGGAYGRNFERNGGKTVEDFVAGPEVYPAIHNRYQHPGQKVVDYVTIDVFHFLLDRVDYAPEMDMAFREFALAPEREREPWFTCLDEWLDDIGAENPDRYSGGEPIVVNTYNGEDALSQVVQYTVFRNPADDEVYVALSIHGGCDVRGGYTAPRLFTFGSWAEWYCMFDNASFTMQLREPDPTPDAMAQGALLDEYPTPVRGRIVTIDFQSGEPDRQNYPTDEAPEVEFGFGDTPVEVTDDGRVIITEGPGKGWEVVFFPWPA
jgi:hypothetical protein